ncbi:hypothetical protein K3495_g8812 [Podosphaera aphanis]|nr:hypothetical protein K3495_g8812 [Podosphaera aphanis]
MSSISSNSPVPDAAGEPKKKGARGGKRSVTHLSKAQLARKRANDREAQRNIRQRTKEHIGNLERKVKELEQNGRSSSMERVLKRNQELEVEVEKLRAQLGQSSVPPATRISSEMPDELLVPQKVQLEWIPSSNNWNNPEMPATSNGSYPSSEAPSFTPTSYDEEPAQSLYTSNASPVWNEQAVFPQGNTPNLSKPNQVWSSYQSSYPSSRFSSPVPSQTSNFSDHVNLSSYASPFWQNQPSIYAWQISTKMKPPHTYMDQLMLSK